MPKYFIKIDYSLNAKEGSEIVLVEERSVKTAISKAAMSVYRKIGAKKSDSFRVNKTAHKRIKEEINHQTSNQRKRQIKRLLHEKT